MTDIKDITTLLLALIPEDMKSDDLINDGLVEIAAMDMASKLGLNDFRLVRVDKDDGTVETYIEPELDYKQTRLAAYLAYGLYLDKLMLIFTNDAINFSTLTFSIKGLEKRPERIKDAIYYNHRYCQEMLDGINSTSSVIGTAKQFGKRM